MTPTSQAAPFQYALTALLTQMIASTHLPTNPTWAAWTSPHSRLIILHYHGKMSNRLWGLVQAAQVGLVGRCVDAIICVSNAVSAYWKGAACEVGVIYNAVEAYAGPDRTGFSKTQSEEKCLLIAASLCVFEK